MAKKTERAEEEYELTNIDWGKIHARAWINDPKDLVSTTNPIQGGDPIPKRFREALETDPTAAIRHYLGPRLRSATIKIVKLRPPPDPNDVPCEFWEDVNPFPPSCC